MDRLRETRLLVFPAVSALPPLLEEQVVYPNIRSTSLRCGASGRHRSKVGSRGQAGIQVDALQRLLVSKTPAAQKHLNTGEEQERSRRGAGEEQSLPLEAESPAAVVRRVDKVGVSSRCGQITRHVTDHQARLRTDGSSPPVALHGGRGGGSSEP
ncbi:hypothetical protein EYF80_043343 [Liparis tanakae]|uniref:Uncharacterized protein n=1 Tax=Liparis tanakae TaxID=230148 RepID=A0A4Z2FYZ3_9TELE|nr:hypothetical protein EYF80_043343 [Liparis tanakae]